MNKTKLARIVAALPAKLWDAPSLRPLCSGLAAFFNGEHLHMYDSWNVSGGWKSLRGVESASRALAFINKEFPNIRINWGNDAPRGGITGKYFHITQRNNRNYRFFIWLLNKDKFKMILENLDNAIAEIDSLSDGELDGAKLPAKKLKFFNDYLMAVSAAAMSRGLVNAPKFEGFIKKESYLLRAHLLRCAHIVN